MDIISINNMHVQCYIGIHRHERHERQTLVLDVDMHIESNVSADKTILQNTIDYSRVYGELKFILEAAHFRLLETAAEALCSYLLSPPASDRPHPQIKAVTLKLSKPSALKSEAVPSLQVHRVHNDYSMGHEKNHFGEVDIIHESSDCGIYRLLIPAGGSIPAHYHNVLSEGEVALSDGLLLQGNPLKAGLAHYWPQKFIHEYRNPTQDTKTVLCVNRPAFIPSDEILVMPPFELLDPPAAIKVRYF